MKMFLLRVVPCLDVREGADECFEVSLEGILELLLVFVAELVGEHVRDALS